MDEFHLHLSARGSAFADAPAAELTRILRELADKIDAEGPSEVMRLKDVNGNRVGYATINAEVSEQDDALAQKTARYDAMKGLGGSLR